ncbi:MAG: hypothetical protein ABI445_20680 [Polyangia bacterium]
MRGVVVAVLLLGCGAAPTDGKRYLGDRDFRRATLEDSLVSSTNAYGALRLTHYAHDWDALPVWNPACAPVGEPVAQLELDDPLLGEHAFFRYPVQLVNERATGPQLVDVRLADGSLGRALSCASCHSRVVEGVTVPGLANQTFDVGALLGATWPPGHVDVSASGTETPIAIADLRSASLQHNLQASGEVRNGRIALAIRIETLIVTAHGGALRPPREVALALADYLATLAPPAIASNAVFEDHCASCHAGEAMSGPPVEAATVATDPRAADSPDRGTGGYRVPSLRGVGTRGALFHDASVPSIDALLDPARTGGHPFSRTLSSDERAVLNAYLHAL